MKIDDEDLRLLFKTTSDERLQIIDENLLHLEKHPTDQAAIEVILREAHSLKGDSNMLGLKELGTLAHHIEAILGDVKRGNAAFSAALGDRLAGAMQAISQLVQTAVTGEPPTIHPVQALANLLGHPPAAPFAPLGDSAPAPPSALTESLPVASDAWPESEAMAETLPAMALSPAGSPPAANGDRPDRSPPPAQPQATVNAEGGATSSYHIETIRVPTQTLDKLMTYAGELTVTEGRINHRLADIQAIAQLHDDWSREILKQRFLGRQTPTVEPGATSASHDRDRSEHYLEKLGHLVKNLQSTIAEDSTRLEAISNDLEESIRTLRLLPLSTLFNLFPRLVRDLARQEGKQVELVIDGGETQADKRILEEMKDPLMHVIRNAIDHGLETTAERLHQGKPATSTIYLRGYQTTTSIILEVQDDGRGLDTEAIKETAMRRNLYRWEDLDAMTPHQIHALILSSGFSTRQMVTEISGRGVGLDVLRAKVEALKGEIAIASTPNQGCTFRIQLSTNLAAAHVLLVSVQSQTYAIPVETVKTTCLVQRDRIFRVEGRQTIQYDGQPVSVVSLAELLELPTPPPPTAKGTSTTNFCCVLLQVGLDCLGIFVDALLDEQDVVLKAQSKLLQRVRNVSGATILGDGSVCMVLNPRDLIQSARRSPVALHPTQLITMPERRPTILLVEDSIATRTQEKRILEAAGYEVITAVDGADGWNKLTTRAVDAIVSDVQMPNLDGLQLTAKVRAHREYNDIPIILVTTLASESDRQRGAEAGANAYLTKGSFKQDILLETLERLI